MSENTNPTTIDNADETTEGTQTAKVYTDIKPYDAFLLIEKLHRAGLCEARTSQEMFNLATRWAKRTPAKAYKLAGTGKGLWRLDGTEFAAWLKSWCDGDRSATSGKRSIESMVEEYTS